MLECVVVLSHYVVIWELPSHVKNWDGDTFLRTAVILVHVRSIINPNRKTFTNHLPSQKFNNHLPQSNQPTAKSNSNFTYSTSSKIQKIHHTIPHPQRHLVGATLPPHWWPPWHLWLSWSLRGHGDVPGWSCKHPRESKSNWEEWISHCPSPFLQKESKIFKGKVWKIESPCNIIHGDFLGESQDFIKFEICFKALNYNENSLLVTSKHTVDSDPMIYQA